MLKPVSIPAAALTCDNHGSLRRVLTQSVHVLIVASNSGRTSRGSNSVQFKGIYILNMNDGAS